MTSPDSASAELLLTLTDPITSGPRNRRLRNGYLVVGRSAPSDWILDDPERQLSKQHCRFECRQDRFVATDISINGLFVNGSSAPLGNGNSVELMTGDLLTLGPYTLRVSISSAPPPALPGDTLDGLGRVGGWPFQSDAPAQESPDSQGPGAVPRGSWLDGPTEPRAPQNEFFQPPPVTGDGIPDDWFAQAGNQPPLDPSGLARPPSLARIPGADSAEVAISDLRAHLLALHEAVNGLLNWLPPDQAEEAQRILQRGYGAARYK